MSDEKRNEEEIEVEAHTHRAGANDEPREDAEVDDEVEGHIHRAG